LAHPVYVDDDGDDDDKKTNMPGQQHWESEHISWLQCSFILAWMIPLLFTFGPFRMNDFLFGWGYAVYY